MSSTHTVKNGESLNTIAKRYNVSEEALRDANALEQGDSLPGELRIPTRAAMNRVGARDSLPSKAANGSTSGAMNAAAFTSGVRASSKATEGGVEPGDVEAAFAMLVAKLGSDPNARKETQALIKKYTGKEATSSADLVKSLAPVLAANPMAAKDAVKLAEKYSGTSLPGGDKIVQEHATEVAAQLGSAKALSEAPSRGEDKNVIVGFAKGLWGGASELVKGVWDLGKGAVKLSGIAGKENQEHAWETLKTTVKTVKDNPGAVWDAIKEPYAKAWAEGDYGYIAGRGVFDVVTTIGTGGIGGAGKTGVQVGTKVAIAAEKAAVVGEKVAIAGEKVAVASERLAIAGEKVAVASEKAAVVSEKATVAGEKATVAGEKAAVAGEGASTSLTAASKTEKVDEAAAAAEKAAKATEAANDVIRAAMKDPDRIDAIATALEKAGVKHSALLKNYAARLRSLSYGNAEPLTELETAGRMSQNLVRNAMEKDEAVAAAVRAAASGEKPAARAAETAANAGERAGNAGARTSSAGERASTAGNAGTRASDAWSSASSRASQASAKAGRAAEEAAAAATSKLKRAATWMGTTTMGKVTAATLFGMAGGPLMAPLGWYLAKKLPGWMGIETKGAKVAAEATRAAQAAKLAADLEKIEKGTSLSSKAGRAAFFVGVPAADRLNETVNASAVDEAGAAEAPDLETWIQQLADQGHVDPAVLMSIVIGLGGVDLNDEASLEAFSAKLSDLDAGLKDALTTQAGALVGPNVDSAAFTQEIANARGEATPTEINTNAGVGTPEITDKKLQYGIYTAGPSLDDVRLGATLQRGHSGGGVKDAQRLLNKLGAGLATDGKMGPKTEAAVREFQKAQKLPVTGKVDAQTLAALEKATPGSVRLSAQAAATSFPPAKKSEEMSAMITDALADAKARGIAVPPEYEQWAKSPQLMKILERESGGRVGIPNYTFGAAARDPAQWANIQERLKKGEVWTESTATGLFQLTKPNVKKYYPDGMQGIGDRTNEVLGGLRYIQERYGTPERALAFHFEHNWY